MSSAPSTKDECGAFWLRGRRVLTDMNVPVWDHLEALVDADVPALHIAHLAVRGLPGSGTPAELLNEAGISARHVVDAARRLVTP